MSDILRNLGGGQGEEGGAAAISKLFGGKDLRGILSELRSNGLGEQVKSWIGSGENQPVSGHEIKGAMDQQTLDEVARQQGVSSEELSHHIAEALPGLVDKATPGGQVPRQAGSPTEMLNKMPGFGPH